MKKNREEKKLNTEQLKAIKFGNGPLLIIAGAGTGKTTVITERIKWLVSQKKAKPQEILALTFTQKASQEMEERVDVAMPLGFTQMWISTFHSFCDRILRNEGLQIGLDPRYNLLTQAETIQFFKKNLFKFELNYFRPLGNPTRFIEGIIQHFSRLKDEDVLPKEYLEFARGHQSVIASTFTAFSVNEAKQSQEILKQVQNDDKNEIASSLSAPRNDADNEQAKYLELVKAYQTYENLKIKEGVLDFSDLIANVLKLFRIRPNILKQYQKQFKYLLVDEFQDTNFAQYQLIKLLAPPKNNPNLTVVGDDNQSIYKFRGAAISNILQFMDEYKSAKRIILNKNYRSTQTILDCAHKLIKNNDPDTLEAKLGINKDLKAVRFPFAKASGDKDVEFVHEDRVENEAEEVAKEINRVISANGFIRPPLADRSTQLSLRGAAREWPLRRTGYKYSDFAILVRANNHAEPFIRALARYNIPYQFLGPGMLFKKEEVKNLIAYLKVLANFEDSVAMYRVLVMDIFNINARDLAAMLIFGKKNNLSLFEACEKIKEIAVSESCRQTVEKIAKTITHHLELVKKETAGQILYYFLQDSGLLQKLTEVNSVAEEKKANNVSKFFDKLKTYEVEHEDASVYAVSDWLDLSLDLGESPLAADLDWTENDAVNILTIHSAKGLEFPIVFLVNLVSQRFPTIERREQIPIPEALIKEILPIGDYHLEEERRLFYVGLTRARDKLYLTAADYYGEGKREKKISPFVAEALGDQVLGIRHEGLEKPQFILSEWSKSESKDLKPKPYTLSPIEHLSFSQLEGFNNCPLQYKYRFIIKIPTPVRSAQSFGDSMHKTLKDFYEHIKNGDPTDLKRLLEIYENLWSPLGYNSKDHELQTKRKGREMLKNFYKQFNPENLSLDLEKSFSLRLSPSLKLIGKIDRVDKSSKGLEIIDYKTGKPAEQKQVDASLQMTIYALAVTDKNFYGISPEDLTLTFYFLESGEKKSTTRTMEQLKTAKEEIIVKAKEIEKSDFPAKPGKLCSFCDFRLICSAWQ